MIKLLKGNSSNRDEGMSFNSRLFISFSGVRDALTILTES